MDGDAEHLTPIEPENPRYSTDVVFLHGLWASPVAWGRVAAAMAHRGWRCWLLDARGREGGEAGLDSWRERAIASIRSLDAAPVLVGHDAGGLVALRLAAEGVPRAVIAVAPLVEGTGRLLSARRRLLARWVGGPVEPPPAPHPGFAGLGAGDLARVRATLRPEAGATLADVRGEWLAPAAPAVPALVVGQEHDGIVPPMALRIVANGIGADFLELPGTHWPMGEQRIDAWTTRLHRWLIRRLGSDVLLLSGDEDLRDD